MAEEIKQVLGFDASGAIEELKRLDKAMLGFRSSLGTFSASFKEFNRGAGKTISALKRIQGQAGATRNALGKGFAIPAAQQDAIPTQVTEPFAKTETSSKKAAASLNKLRKRALAAEKQLKQVGETGSKAANRLIIDFETFSRIVGTQLVVRAFGSLKRALDDAVSQAFEFQAAIREIATIDPRVNTALIEGIDVGPAIQNIEKDVLALSNAFNIPLLETSRGLYQAISNQIARTGTESQRAKTTVDFLSESFKFARGAVVDAESATNLLAGTINAFELSVEDADIVASKFFKTIELGRTTGRELARSFGSVAPIAKQLGISLDELNASFTTITIGGVDTAKAATQIRGVMSSLLKPTKDMTRAFEDLGVANGEELIELFGLQKGLEAVIATTDGSAQSIGKLIPRLRGLGGALRLVSEGGAKTFAEDLEELQNVSRNLSQTKFDLSISTDAFQVQRDLEKLRKFLITDFGNSFISATKSALDLAGGVTTFTSVATSMGKVLTTVLPLIGLTAVAWKGYSTAVALAAAETRTAALVIGSGAGAALGAALLISFVGGRIDAAREAFIKGERDAFQALIDGRKRKSDAEIAIEETKNKKILSQIKLLVIESKKANAQLVKDAKLQASQYADSFKDAANRILQVNLDVEQEISRNLKSNIKDRLDAQKNFADQTLRLEDRRFELSIENLSTERKVGFLSAKVREDQLRANELLKKSQTDQSISLDDVRAAFERAVTSADKLKQAAGATKGFADDSIANQAILDTLGRRRDVEKDLGRLSTRRASTNRRELETVEKNNVELKKLIARSIELTGVLKTDSPLTANFKEAEKELGTLLPKIAKTLQSTGEISAQQALGLLQSSLDQIRPADIKKLAASPEALKGLRSQVQEALAFDTADLDTNIRVSFEQAGISGKFSSAQDFISEVQKILSDNTLSTTLLVSITDADELKVDVVNQIREIEAGLKKITLETRVSQAIRVSQGQLDTSGLAPDPNAAQQIKDLTLSFLELIKAGKELPKIDVSKFEGLGFAIKKGELDTALAFLKRTVDLSQQQQERLKQTGTVSENTARLEELRNTRSAEQIGILEQGLIVLEKQKETEKALNTAAQDVNKTLTETISPAQNIRNLAKETATFYSDAEQSAGRIGNGSTPNGVVQGFASGGFVSRGTDTIPAMLSKGEFVVNARSTRKFFSEIQSLNAGVRPSFRQNGGPVSTSITIGDIIVSGADSPRATGREVLRELKRESRKNTPLLN